MKCGAAIAVNERKIRALSKALYRVLVLALNGVEELCARALH